MRVAISGGASGIGAAAARRLKADGAQIVCFDRVEPTANCDQWIAVDLSKPEAIAAAAGLAEEPFDALINSAGLPPRPGFEQMILAVNYFGLVALTRGLESKLRGEAAIVNMASRAGARWRDNIDQVKALMRLSGPQALPEFIAKHDIDPVRAYDLSKEAVIAWTTAQTERFAAKGRRVNAVSPAAVKTGILDDFVTAFGERARNGIARTGRPADAEEIADVICFLVAPQSRWIRGANIVADGGIAAFADTDRFEIPV